MSVKDQEVVTALDYFIEAVNNRNGLRGDEEDEAILNLGQGLEEEFAKPAENLITSGDGMC